MYDYTQIVLTLVFALLSARFIWYMEKTVDLQERSGPGMPVG